MIAAKSENLDGKVPDKTGATSSMDSCLSLPAWCAVQSTRALTDQVLVAAHSVTAEAQALKELLQPLEKAANTSSDVTRLENYFLDSPQMPNVVSTRYRVCSGCSLDE